MSGKAIVPFFQTAFAHFVSLGRILVIPAIFPFLVIILSSVVICAHSWLEAQMMVSIYLQ